MDNIENKKKKIGRIIISLMILLAVSLLISLIYFFLLKKPFSFYLTRDIREIEAVSLHTQEGDENQEIFIYDENVIKEVMDEVKKLKLKPYYSMADTENSESGFSIIFYGKDKQEIMFLADKMDNAYNATIVSVKNGSIDEGIKNLISCVSIPKDAGEYIYELIKKKVIENRHKISVTDIELFSQEKEYDWKKYQQYIYDEVDIVEVGNRRRSGLDTGGVAHFNIEGKKGYVIVWYYDGIISKDGERNKYTEVIDAVVYNEKGEEMNLYNEEISTFLEEME